MLLADIVANAARRAPDTRAVTTLERSITFSDLDRNVDAWAAWLAQVTEPGDRVAILSENRIEYVELLYACARSGRIAAPLNHRLHPGEWDALMQQCAARILVGERRFLDRVVDSDRTSYDFDRFSPDPASFVVEGDERETVWLIATSGTTGLPKWAKLTHRSLTAGITNLALARTIVDDDVLITPFPMCHVAVYNVLAFHLRARPVVLLATFDPTAFNLLIERERARTLSLAPTMIATWLDDASTASADLTSVRVLGYGASAIPGPVLERAVARLGQADLSQGYGMTELSGNAVFLDGDEHRAAAAGDLRRLRAAGRPGPLVAVKIVDDEGRELAPAQSGEICVRGDQVCAGYWEDPEATAVAFGGDGWFRTGDVGRLDSDGLLSIVDRKKDVIVTGGENVASREVEQVLERHPSVREVAVIGVPDPVWGENVCAVVVASNASDPPMLSDLVDFSRDHLAGFKKPKRLELVDELPKNATGKVQKQLLRERFTAR
jgi:acyl-CoA synthetase (AMP-forming)/AMP-acid ligase II